jgi:glycosyltransferase involved in cell wall biosynthesis
MPEVIGDAGEYFDPNESASIACAIERVVGSAELKSALIEKGRQRISLYSWQRCTDETLAVYRSLL